MNSKKTEERRLALESAIASIDEILAEIPNFDESLDRELSSFDFEWLEAAKAALEKQVPQKPILKETKCFDGSTADFVFVCPVCNRTLFSDPFDKVLAHYLKEEHPHCNCGQALDWEG